MSGLKFSQKQTVSAAFCAAWLQAWRQFAALTTREVRNVAEVAIPPVPSDQVRDRAGRPHSGLCRVWGTDLAEKPLSPFYGLPSWHDRVNTGVISANQSAPLIRPLVNPVIRPPIKGERFLIFLNMLEGCFGGLYREERRKKAWDAGMCREANRRQLDPTSAETATPLNPMFLVRRAAGVLESLGRSSPRQAPQITTHSTGQGLPFRATAGGGAKRP